MLVTVPEPLLVHVDWPEKPLAVVVTFPFEPLEPPPPPPAHAAKSPDKAITVSILISNP